MQRLVQCPCMSLFSDDHLLYIFNLMIRGSIYRSPAMVTKDVFLVSLFVGAAFMCASVMSDLFLSHRHNLFQPLLGVIPHIVFNTYSVTAAICCL